jgi:hypothetical protein
VVTTQPIIPAESAARHAVQRAFGEALPSPYPADVRQLLALVDDYLAEAEAPVPPCEVMALPRNLVRRMHAYLTQGLPTLDAYEALVEHAATAVELAEEAATFNRASEVAP